MKKKHYKKYLGSSFLRSFSFSNFFLLTTEMATLALPAGIETDGAIRLFNKWSYDDVEVKDISLIDYIQVKAPVYLPHTAGRFASKRFRKAQCPIVERLTNALMMHGRNNGKKLMAVRIVKHAFEIIHLLSDQNPIQVLVDAIINTGPREDSTRIGSAGTVRRQAVDVSPLRRVNQAVSLLTIGVSSLSWKKDQRNSKAGTASDRELQWSNGKWEQES